jgi:hypothetical protein
MFKKMVAFFLNAKQNILWIVQGFVCVSPPVLYWDVLDSAVFFMNNEYDASI